MTVGLLIVFAAVLAGAFIQGASGMGFALIVVPVLALVHPEAIPGALLFLMLPLNAYVAWRERGAIDRSGAGWITVGRFAGTFAGLGILLVLSTYWLNQFVGISTLLAVLASVLAPSFTPGKKAFIATGLVTGITETATGIGGPPLALVYQHAPVATLRSTVALCFLVGEVISLAVLGISGALQWSHLSYAVLCLPALLLGMGLSSLVHHKLDQRRLRIGVLVFATVSGLAVMLT
ncbi:sulfite exporter TauE/SafE family protein [Alcaligenes sp. 1735tsa3]|uniref:Probable membrane transporter protein n=1 Tax=Alcaligenes faecalis TaxID=511 RepID=A0AAE9HAZ5_ALCFA|nr:MULTISPECIES: sulfite exporter TauE/SafE family protein [Alcaligenes]UPL19737.1 sulfite exporter TauE/SafE family protein [Alcaligenes faecalis]USY27153.1 sulfite exporter TauE/SafE family protein [Alcaligenes sp. 1735tsa3]